MRIITMGPSKFFTSLNGNPTLSWDFVRKDVGEQLFGKKYSTVPLLNEAKYFDLLSVYSKEESTTSCFLNIWGKPTYKRIGWLRDLLAYPLCNERRLYAIKPRDGKSDIGPVYQFSAHETYEGYLKEVIVRIFDIYHQISDLGNVLPGEIFLDSSNPVLNGLDDVYIISEVFLCHRFYLYTRMGRREIIDNQRDDRFPLAFRSEKFYLNSDGSIHARGKSKPRRGPDDAIWIPSGMNNLMITNLPLLPLPSSDDISLYQDTHTPVSLEGHRYHNGNLVFHPANRLSLRCMDDTPFRVDDPDQDIIRDHGHLQARTKL